MDHYRDRQLSKLTERAKELRCIYTVNEILKDDSRNLNEVFMEVIEAIPPAWQFPTVCEVQILFNSNRYTTNDFYHSPWLQRAEIVVDNHVVGEIDVCYTQNIEEVTNPFLPEEQKLLNTIAERLSQFILHRQLKNSLDFIQSNGKKPGKESEHLILADDFDEHWKWRYQVAEKIAARMDLDRYGVEAVYLIGSTKNATAGAESDIDLLVHFRGSDKQQRELEAYMEGWGHGLDELNFLKTGYRTEGNLIDLHLITDHDIEKKSSYAFMIVSTEDKARLLKSRKS